MNKSRSAAGTRLARLGKGAKKTLSVEERKRRGEQGKAALLAYHARVRAARSATGIPDNLHHLGVVPTSISER